MWREPGRPRSVVHMAILAMTLVALAGTLALAARPSVALLSLAEKAILIGPGLLLVRAVAGPAAGWLPVVAFGPFIGFGLGSLALTGIWMAGGRGMWTLAAAAAIVGLLLPWAGRLRGRWLLPVTGAGDRTALCVLLLVVPLVVAAPFANVGREIHVGTAYRAYFTADYVWRRTVVAELAKGDTPPVNPFYREDVLHYYWLPHLSTAVAYRAETGDLDELLLVHSVAMDVFFVAFLYGLARWFVPRPVPSALGVAAVILATSYEGAYSLWEHWDRGAPLTLVRYLNIDAVARWRFEGMPIDGLQRVLFYQPHHAAGYALGFMGVLAVSGRVRRYDPPAMAVAGMLLGLSTLVSSFAGLMLTAVAALYEGCSCLRRLDWWRAVSHAAAAALPLVLAAALVTALQYVDSGGRIILFGPNALAFHNVLLCTALSMGPMLVIGGLAVWVSWDSEQSRALVFAALAAICIAFYFWVDVRDHQNVYVGWRVGHLWFIGSAALAAMVFDWVRGLGHVSRPVATVLLTLTLVAGLPTTGIDIYNTQDIYNWGAGPGFTWTLILSHEEQQAFAWIKAHTPRDAVFQVDAIQRDVEGWAYLPAFAERRLGVGLPISMVPLRKYEEGSRRASWIFETSSASSAHAIAARNGIAYLFLGSPERKRHPTAVARFDAAPEFFERVFQNREVTIYKVK